MTDDALSELFDSERERLFALAYRMLGSVGDAEDVVQDAFLRYQARAGGEAVREPRALLTTIATRLAIDQLRSSRHRREAYVGEWLPEPLVGAAPAAAERAELAESLSMAFLVVLETLSPVERAVFLLREAFDYDYETIAAIVERRPEHCRQIALRARRHVDARRPRFDPSPGERDRLARRFFAACQDGDLGALVELLAADCVLHGDGGGRAPAVRAPLHGRERVARAVAGFARAGSRIGARSEPVVVNGQPGARFLDRNGRLINVVALDIADGRVQAVRSIVNPDKLDHLGPLADVHALLAQLTGRR
jgi:RNA polymerase sigma-70 factor (ECF subfamily)